MKTLRIVLLIALIAGFAFAGPVEKARAAVSYETCFQIQNMDATAGTLIIQYYPQDKNLPAIEPNPQPTIAASGSFTACPITPGSGFNGSAVISSDVQIAAIVNVFAGSNYASYDGFSVGTSQVNIPLLFKNVYGYNTWFNIQNAGGSAAATVTVAYSSGLNVNYTIEPNRSVTVKQADEAGLANGIYAASVTSTNSQPIVVSVVEESAAVLFAYDGFADSSTAPVMPLVMANNSGYVTGIQLQNTTAVTTTVTIDYTPSLAGTACSETRVITPKSSTTFMLEAFAANDPNTGSNNNCANGLMFVGSAKVSANTTSAGLVGIVNQLNSLANKGAAYGTINPANAKSAVVLPLIMDRNYGFFTGFNIMNIGGVATTVDCTFSGSASGYDFTAVPLDPGEAVTVIQGAGTGQTNLGAGYVGSAICTASDPSHKIAAIVNELNGGSSADSFMVYEGFSK